MSRLLITTADERTWAGDCPVVFLGKWCLRPAREHAWNLLDGFVAEPFYPDIKRRLELSDEARSIRVQIMDALPSRLNEYHGVDYGRRYWEMLVGPFLTRYIRVMINRYLTLEQCLNHYSCDRSITLESNFSVVPNDTLHFLNLVDNDAWNDRVCSWLIRDFFGDVRIQTVEVTDEPDKAQTVSAQTGLRTAAVGQLRRAATTLIEYVNSKATYYIHDLSASRQLKLCFNLLNRQIPINRPYSYALPRRPISDRTGLSLDGVLKNKTAGYHFAIERYFNKLLPFVFAEQYSDLVRAVMQRPFPHDPKAIITSTAFDTDEIFKTWAAEKVRRGAKYIVLQHGAVYGTNPFFANTIEELTSDAFITWGWQKRKSDILGFCLSTPGRKLRRGRPRGRLLLVEMTLRRRKFIWDTYHEFDRYQNSQLAFLENLPIGIRDKTTIRLHSAHLRSCGNEKEALERAFPDIKIDDGHNSIWESLPAYRIAIFSYDSTGILEFLNMGIPVLAFWDRDGIDQFDRDAAPYYDRLVDAGILHFDPISIAHFLASIWDSIDEWWDSNTTRSARELFCGRYSSKHDASAMRLNQLINSACTAKDD